MTETTMNEFETHVFMAIGLNCCGCGATPHEVYDVELGDSEEEVSRWARQAVEIATGLGWRFDPD